MLPSAVNTAPGSKLPLPRPGSPFLERRNEAEETFGLGLQIISEFLPNVEISPTHSKPIFLAKFFLLNNHACFLSCLGDLNKAKKQLKSLLQETENTSPTHFAILTNNLATVFLRKRDFLKAYKYSEMGLFRLEPLVFKQMKDPIAFQSSFKNDLMVLLQGYLNYATCLMILQSA